MRTSSVRVFVAAALFLFASVSRAQSVARPAPRITVAVDNSRTIRLRGNTHPLAQAQFDLGAAEADQPMSRMMLVLRRSKAQQAALDRLLAAQQDPSSAQFHQWITPSAFGAQFGIASEDLEAITAWLQSQGFHDIHADNGRRVIEFSGNAGQVSAAFHSSIERYSVNGELYSANASDPQIPAALAPVIGGIVTLHNFPRQRYSEIAGTFTHDASGGIRRMARSGGSAGPRPSSSIPYQNTTLYGVSPYDFATIYNVLPLWSASTPIDGAGQTIAIVGQSDINAQDFVSFRSLFGLPLGDTSGPTGTQYLKIIHNGPAPGIIGDEIEADLDTQWSSAVAKGATIEYVVSSSTETSEGVDLSAEYIVDNDLAPVMSTSYGACELALGSGGNAFYSDLYQQASAEGITVITSSGDSGSAGCDPADRPVALHGLAVSGLNSTPYNVSVGGTDFYMPGNGSTYWNATNSSATSASVKSYIPEIPWNDGCGNSIVDTASVFHGMSPEQVCNDTDYWYAPYDLLLITSGGGGRSACTQSDGATLASCSTPYPKPSWQAGPGVPADGVRDVPDLSFFAGNGEFNAFYIVCDADLTRSPNCGLGTSPTSEVTFDFVGIGGTSASSPAFAGVMALVNQQTGSRQGNANYVLYKLAAQQSSAGCNSSVGSGAACIFNDITQGSNVVPCQLRTPDCTSTSSSDFYGVLGGYTTGAGYDLATGLGSVNVANLVHGWNGSGGRMASNTSLQLNPVAAVHGTPVNARISVWGNGGTPSGLVALNGNTPEGSIGSATLSGGQTTQAFDTLPGGTYAVTAHYAGDSAFAASDSAPTTVTISPESSTEAVAVKTIDPDTGAITQVTSAAYGSFFIVRADIGGKSGEGVATGSVTLTDNGGTFDKGTYPLNSEGFAEDTIVALNAGQHTLTATYAGDASFSPGSGSQVLTVTPMPMTCTYQSNTTVLRPGWGLNLGMFASASRLRSTDPFYIPSGTTPPPSGTLSVYEGTKLISGPISSLHASGGLIIPCLTGGCYSVPGVYTQQNIAAAQIQLPLLPVTVVYSGDSNHASCTSAPLNLTYQTGPVGSIIMSYLLNPQYPFTQNATANFNITVQAATPPPVYEPAYPYSTGTIQPFLDNVPYGSPLPLNAQGTTPVAISTTGMSAGSHLVSFSYSGDTNFLPSTGGQYSLSIAAPSFTLSPSSYSISVVGGATVTSPSIQVIPLAGFTGTVTFACSGLPRGASCAFSPATAGANGTTSVAISSTKAAVRGPGAVSELHPPSRSRGGRTVLLAFGIVVPFAMRKRYRRSFMSVAVICTLPLLLSCGGSSSAAGGGGGGISPAPIASIVTLSTSSPLPAENASVTVGANVSGYGSSAPTGSVTFFTDNSTTGVSTPVASSSASYSTSFSTPGIHTIRANYSGDSNYQPSTSNSLQLNVQYASGTAPGQYGITVTGTSGSLSSSMRLYLTVQ